MRVVPHRLLDLQLTRNGKVFGERQNVLQAAGLLKNRMTRLIVRAPGIVSKKRQVQGKQDAYDTEKIRRDPTIGSEKLGVLRSLGQPQQDNNRRDRPNNGDQCEIVLVVLAYMCPT